MKPFHHFCITLCLILGITLSAQAADIVGNNELKKEKRNFETPFTEIISEGDFNIRITYSVTCEVEIEAESNLIEHIVTEAKGKSLTIKAAKKSKLLPNMPMTIHITMPLISKATYNGTGTLSIDAIRTEKFELSTNGNCQTTLQKLSSSSMKITLADNGNITGSDIASGDTKITLKDKSVGTFNSLAASKLSLTAGTINAIKFEKVTADNVDITANNSGSIDLLISTIKKAITLNVSQASAITLSGTAPAMTITTSGSNTIDAMGLNNEKCKVTNTGSGTVKVATTGSLDIVLDKSANIEYKNRPKIKFENNGSGQIINKNQ